MWGQDEAPPALSTRRVDAGAAGRNNMLLLIQLRWIAVAGEIVTIALVHFLFMIRLPLVPLATVIEFQAALNVIGLLRLRSGSGTTNAELFLVLLGDVGALTAQLWLTGGATNPFISLFLLQVTLGAVLLSAPFTWALVTIISLCFAGLTTAYRPLPVAEPVLFGLQIRGLAVCFLLDATLLVVFVTRITRNLRARDAHLADLRQHAAEEAHIVRMGLLASGAAHELGTPLSTVSVILNDWRRLPVLAGDADMLRELDDMEAEIRRCKEIVSGVLLSAGEARGEAPALTTVSAFLAELVEDWRVTRNAAHVVFTDDFGRDMAMVSDSALRQVLANVLDNALEVSPSWVGISAYRDGSALVLAVRDAGPGFAPDMLANFGKPYHSTKGRRGGGLGLFLVVNVVRKLGGSVAAQNHPEGGATVTLSLPLPAIAADPGG